MPKKGITQILRERDATLTKDSAAALVICRNVYVDGELCTDPKAVFPQNAAIDILYPKYVSRGGFKMEQALKDFGVSVKGLAMLDAGSSTGGFTDCLLQNGASSVTCVDVGYNLLDFSIRSDSRTHVHERQNIMTLRREDLEVVPDAAVADLSFRSIRGAGSHVIGLTRQGWMIALIKPQFEVPKWQEGFDGVVRDPKLLEQTLRSVFSSIAEDGLAIEKATVSPIKGHKGNTEFLVLLKRAGECVALDEQAFLDACLGQMQST